MKMGFCSVDVKKKDLSKSGIIYLLTFPSGKFYIGQTISTLKKRLSEHINHSVNKNKNRYSANAIQKYKSMKVSILAESKNRNILNYLEIFYIKLFDSTNKKNGYNITSGGNCGSKKEVPKEVGNKISRALKERYKDPEKRAALNKSRARGFKMTTKQKQLLSDAHKEKVYCPELNITFESKNSCADALGMTRQAIYKAIERGYSLRNTYKKKLTLLVMP